MWAKAFHDVFYAIEKDKKVRLIFSVVDFTVFLLIPNIYYGLIRGNLYRNFWGNKLNEHKSQTNNNNHWMNYLQSFKI